MGSRIALLTSGELEIIIEKAVVRAVRHVRPAIEPNTLPPRSPDAIPPREAARRSGYKVETILAAVERGDLPASKPKGSRLWRILVADFDRWLTGTTTAQVAPEKEDLDSEATCMLKATSARRR